MKRTQPAALEPVITLACTACQHVYQPQPADFGSGNTGCLLCGGWTWVAELSTANASMSPDPTVTRPRTAAGSGSPTTAR